jgi:uncharacterized protein with PIN domain
MVDVLFQRLGIQIEPLSEDAAHFARAAYAQYGKGVGTPAP